MATSSLSRKRQALTEEIVVPTCDMGRGPDLEQEVKVNIMPAEKETQQV